MAELPFSRRTVMQGGALLLLGAGVSPCSARALAAEKPLVRIGLVTDLHYADKPPAGTRFYRETLAKLAVAGEEFNKARPELLIELGDLIDAAESVEVEQEYLQRIHKQFAALPGEKHHVLGNHCVQTLTKEEFLSGVGQKDSYYSFDAAGVHFVVLDACFRADGQAYGRSNFRWTDAAIPEKEVKWLIADLKQAAKPTIVFVHQRLDVQNDYGVKNAAEVREVLEKAGQVLAVFQGHSHKNDLQEINGIRYCTLAAMIEGSGLEHNSYTLLDVLPDQHLRLTGFSRQKSYRWE